MNRLAISPDKRFLAAAGNGTVKLYDIATSAGGSGGANVGPVRHPVSFPLLPLRSKRLPPSRGGRRGQLIKMETDETDSWSL